MKEQTPPAASTRRLLAGTTGLTLIELIVVLAILGIGLSTATSRLRDNYGSTDSAAAELAANLRLARAKAVSIGYHYQVSVTGTSTYAINRLSPPAVVGNDWTVDSTVPTRTVTMPSNVSFVINGGNAAASGRYEFDTRGGIVLHANEALVSTKSLSDSSQNRVADVAIYSSGQIY